VALLRHTRADERLYLGASPRAGIALLRVAKARAVVEGRDYAVPDDLKAVAETVLSHRVILAPEARAAGLTSAEPIRDALARPWSRMRSASRAGKPRYRRRRASSSIRASWIWIRSSPMRGRAGRTAVGCCSAGPPGSSCTPSASTSAATRSAPFTGGRPPRG